MKARAHENLVRIILGSRQFASLVISVFSAPKPAGRAGVDGAVERNRVACRDELCSTIY
jgi:hypothetical protein